MAVRWDSLLVAGLVRELRERLAGARLQAVHLDGESRDLVLHLRQETLVFRLHPERGTVSALPPSDPLPGARRFASRVRDVTHTPDERWFALELVRRRGKGPNMDLVVELIPNRWNAYMVEVDTRVIRHLLHAPRKGHDPPAVGRIHQVPEPSGRLGALEPVPLERWLEVLVPEEPDERRKALLAHFAYTSRLNAPHFLADGELERGWERWSRLRELPALEPRILRTERGSQPYPYAIPPLEGEPRGTLLEAFEEVGRTESQDPREALLPSDLTRAVERELRRAEGKVVQLEKELEEARDPDALRRIGDLLLARFHEVPHGREEVELTDFEGGTVRVELDPTLPPNENAARYYDDAARAERTRQRLPAMIEEARDRIRALSEALEEAREGRSGAEELARAAGIRPEEAVGTPSRGSRRGPSLPYRRFQSSGGLEIRVGRGARQNDDLTFHHSRPGDVWLHARQATGAHVILRWDRDDQAPPRRDLEEAAVLAALHSEARTSGSVAVDWTRRRYVRKPRKAPPGAVTPDRVETLFVEPDEEMAERLATT